MFCPKCKISITDGSNKCRICNAKLVVRLSENKKGNSIRNANEIYRATEKTSIKKKALLSVLIIFSSIFMLSISLLFLKRVFIKFEAYFYNKDLENCIFFGSSYSALLVFTMSSGILGIVLVGILEDYKSAKKQPIFFRPQLYLIIMTIGLVVTFLNYTYINDEGVFIRTTFSKTETQYVWSDINYVEISTYTTHSKTRGSEENLSIILFYNNGEKSVFNQTDAYLNKSVLVKIDNILKSKNVKMNVLPKAQKLYSKLTEYTN